MERRRLLAGLVLLGTPTVSRAAIIDLAPLKDNTLVQQTNPAGQISGGQGDIFVGRTGQDGQGPPTVSIRRGLIAFDVAAAVPAGATITAATLTMRDVMGLNGDQTVSLHRLLQDWGEGASTSVGAAANGDATWLYTFFQSANPGASPTWSTPGGIYLVTASAASVISDDAGPGQLFSWSSAANPKMLADVQRWQANPAANFGWALVGNEAVGNTAKRFNGGEASGPPATAPVLRVEYVIPEPPLLPLTIAAMIGIVGITRRR